MNTTKQEQVISGLNSMIAIETRRLELLHKVLKIITGTMVSNDEDNARMDFTDASMWQLVTDDNVGGVYKYDTVAFEDRGDNDSIELYREYSVVSNSGHSETPILIHPPGFIFHNQNNTKMYKKVG